MQGGLGNQLFQYAAAKSLAIHKKKEMVIDVSCFFENIEGVTKRAYELDSLNVNSRIATEVELATAKRHSFVRKIRNKLMPYYRRQYYYEPHFHFDSNFLKAYSSTILIGYWQSENYFKGISDIIRSEFEFKKTPGLKTQEVLKQISETNSVSLHIRRGDYINNPETLRMHGICGIDYYDKCINLMKAKVPSMQLFIFSDDIQWVKENLVLPYNAIFVDHNTGDNANEDLYLMSHCKHNVIANSSFSWWGAWLNNNNKKIVMAPSKWFNEFKADTKDLYPADWIVV